MFSFIFLIIVYHFLSILFWIWSCREYYMSKISLVFLALIWPFSILIGSVLVLVSIANRKRETEIKKGVAYVKDDLFCNLVDEKLFKSKWKTLGRNYCRDCRHHIILFPKKLFGCTCMKHEYKLFGDIDENGYYHSLLIRLNTNNYYIFS